MENSSQEFKKPSPSDIPNGLEELFPPAAMDVIVRVFNKETGERIDNAMVQFQKQEVNTSMFSNARISQVNLLELNNGEITIRYKIRPDFFKNLNSLTINAGEMNISVIEQSD